MPEQRKIPLSLLTCSLASLKMIMGMQTYTPCPKIRTLQRIKTPTILFVAEASK